MSNAKIKAVEDFRTLARGFKAVIALSDQLETVGNLEQAENEYRASIDKLGKQQASLLAANKAKVDKAQADADGLLADAKVQAASVKGQAQKAADKMAEQAEQQAAAVVADAHKTLTGLQESIVSAREALGTIEARRKEVTADVDALEAKLKKLLAQRDKLMEV